MAAFCFVFYSIAAEALAPSEVYRRAAPSVVPVYVLDSDRQPTGLGSGVIVAKDRVITNCHFAERGAFIHVARGDSQRRARIVDRARDQDLCLLHVEMEDAPAVRLRRRAELRIGEPAYAIGNPKGKGLALSLSPGLISQIRDLPEMPGVPLIQTTAPISPGSRGGGLFDDSGLLIGVIVGQYKDSQNLNFAIPVDWIDDVLRLEQAEIALRHEQSEIEEQQRRLEQVKRSEEARQEELARSEREKVRLVERIERERALLERLEGERQGLEAQLEALRTKVARLYQDQVKGDQRPLTKFPEAVAAAPPTAPAAPPPAPAAPKKQEVDYRGIVQRYANAWRQEIARPGVGARNYPRKALQEGWEGTARIRVELGRDGKVRSVVLSQSTGYDVLDERALEIMKRVPVPPVPQELLGRELSVEFPISFKIPKGYEHGSYPGR
jgi:TonB family protein